ncbi:rhodanese-like domain-containing protein [Paenibacillus sp. 19GGS1-52]|uniref:rhodanese-like domain-containing protein n=1 Tax=Paenibacillus sp. 19GGS1-52 TaxID=2758563 RepID=UPI001EFBD3F2|nr:rhodanese-like domain-containing protein [Paenibacillus sp. 19GGS1-52]ULO05895.1 rhodanese-like domain-containing protein [Paenibacillus sp. 19GGS1-52]
MEIGTFIYIALLVLLVWFGYSRLRPAKGLITLKSNEFKSEIEQSKNRLLLDVREQNEYKRGYIPSAKNIPLSQLEQRLGEIPMEQNILLYCQSGMRSKNAARVLQKNGYTRLAHLQGGVSTWSGKLTRS